MSRINNNKSMHLDAALREYASHFKDDKTTSDGKKYIIIDKGDDKFQVVEKMGFIRAFLSLIFGKAPYTKKEADKYALAEKVSTLNRRFQDIDPQIIKGIDILYKKLHIPNWQKPTRSRSSSQSSTSSSNSTKAKRSNRSASPTSTSSSGSTKSFIQKLKTTYPKDYKSLIESGIPINLNPNKDPTRLADRPLMRGSLEEILEEIEECRENGDPKKAHKLEKALIRYLDLRSTRKWDTNF